MVEKVKPVVIEVGEESFDPAVALPVPDLVFAAADGKAMQSVITQSARRPSFLARWFLRALAATIIFVVSLAAWNWIVGLIAATPLLGYIASGLIGSLVAIGAFIVAREIAGFSRLRRLDRLRSRAEAAFGSGDLAAATSVQAEIERLYRNRPELEWHLARLADRSSDQFDAEGLLSTIETEIMVPLDQSASAQIEIASRRVATATALIPLAFADVLVALTANIQMIRQIAEIYGGRTGTMGNFRLVRTVMAHLVATGAIAVGDDLIGSIAGGGVLSKLSRRFGEGLINGALTARVGVAAMDVCRPLPFRTVNKPSVSGVVARALTGLFTS